MANDMNSLRNHLFEALQGIKDGKIECDQARAICDIASEISKTASLEINYIRATGFTPSCDFIGGEKKEERNVIEDLRKRNYEASREDYD